MYRSIKPPATSAPAPTIIPPFVVPPRSRAACPSALVLNPLNALKSYYKDSIAWGTLEPKEIESGDTKFNPTKKFQRPYTSDLKQGLTKANKRELLKLLKDTKKEIIEAPEKSPKKLPKKSLKKSPKTPLLCKKATLYKKQTSSPREKAAPAEHPVSPVTFSRSDCPLARVPSPPRTSHLSYILPAAANKALGLNNQDRSKSEEYQLGADNDKTEDKPSLSKKPRLDCQECVCVVSAVVAACSPDVVVLVSSSLPSAFKQPFQDPSIVLQVDLILVFSRFTTSCSCIRDV